MSEPSAGNDTDAFVEELIEELGLERALATAQEAAVEAQRAGDNIELSHWREIKGRLRLRTAGNRHGSVR